jgi:hypothetical protein
MQERPSLEQNKAYLALPTFVYAAARQQFLPLGLVQTSPDSVKLSDAQGIFETLTSHRTTGAYGLGPLLPPKALFLAFYARRWEERRRMGTFAGCLRLPALLEPLHAHRPPSASYRLRIPDERSKETALEALKATSGPEAPHFKRIDRKTGRLMSLSNWRRGTQPLLQPIDRPPKRLR